MDSLRPPIDGGTVLITGTSSGIGLELARQLAPRARALVLVARRVKRLEGLKDELSATPVSSYERSRATSPTRMQSMRSPVMCWRTLER